MPPAFAVINRRFTPVDLVKGAAQVQALRVSELQGKTLAAEVVETLKGEEPKARQISFELGEELDEEDVKPAFGGKKTATAILFLLDQGDKAPADEPDGALLIETLWFAVSRHGGKLALDKDKRQLFAVWGGSARMLAAAARYVQNEPGASFPIGSDMAWGESLKLGKLPRRASGCLVADLGKPAGLCVIVLCESGDRVYSAAPKDGKPADMTAQLKLATASRAAALGDFDGDGRVDLLSWDGRSLKLAAQTADGAFAAPRECAQLAECLSLDCLDAGGPRPGLVAGTSHGPVLLAWDAAGTPATARGGSKPQS
ncbi:MAG: VCBS repeat-containing protein [Planctomycetota bacterium]|nr:VCBS repeat-containing protein [Planctomycetota bacterium]